MYHGRSVDNPALSPDNLNVMLQRDKAFVDRFVMGVWGIPEGAIHKVLPESIIEDIPTNIIDKFIIHGTLYRVMDHGSAAPTCCLWISVYNNVHLVYREYYQGNALVSEHRKAIAQMSSYAGFAESYRDNVADPAIFKKTTEKRNYGKAAVISQAVDLDADAGKF